MLIPRAPSPTASVLALALLGAGCATGHIPNTDVADNSENRSVIAFCERYRHAVEGKDIRTLLNLASPRYYEDAGTPRGDDDYGYDGLQRLLSIWAEEVREVRYEIRYHRITFDHDRRDRVEVDYVYTGSYTLRRPSIEPVAGTARGGASLNIDPVRGATPLQDNDEVWFRRVADNRLELERVGDDWRIISGM